MNTSPIIRTLIIVIIIGISVTNFNFSNSKVNPELRSLQNLKFRTDVIAKTIIPAAKTFKSDFQKFIIEANTKISCNEQNIANLVTQINKNKKTKKVSLDKIIELEKININLKIKLDNYIADGNGNWKSFQSELNKNLAKLEIAYNDTKIKNDGL